MKNISLLLILYNNKVVLFKRNPKYNKYFKNKFGLIGGLRNNNESNLDCLKRESLEEIGFIPKNINFINNYDFYDKKLNVYSGEITDLSLIKLNREHIEYKEFSYNDLIDENIIETVILFFNDFVKLQK